MLIESRVKDLRSFEEKLARPDKAGKYASLNDMTDICGLRAVLYTNEDCDKLVKAIRTNFVIDEKNFILKGEIIERDLMGLFPEPYEYLIKSVNACGIVTLDQFEVKLRSVSDTDIDALLAITNESQIVFGMFTPFLILVINQLPPNLRLQVVKDIPSAGAIGIAEKSYFSRC